MVKIRDPRIRDQLITGQIELIGLVRGSLVKIRDRIMVVLLLIVILIFGQIMVKYWKQRNNVVVEWMKNSKILQQIKAEMLTAQDSLVEGTLSVVPLYLG